MKIVKSIFYSILLAFVLGTPLWFVNFLFGGEWTYRGVCQFVFWGSIGADFIYWLAHQFSDVHNNLIDRSGQGANVLKGYYSNTAARRNGTVFYFTPDGEGVVEVVEVDDTDKPVLRDADLVCVGEVGDFSHVGREPHDIFVANKNDEYPADSGRTVSGRLIDNQTIGGYGG
jgi:hypothetical protein